MKIHNGNILFIMQWLIDNLSLAGKKSRMRMKFCGILEKKFDEYQKYKLTLLKENCNLDDKGEPQEIVVDGKRVYDVIDIDLFNQEFAILTAETFTIDENEDNEEMLMTLKEAIDNCPIEFQGHAAIDYERVAVLFDDIYKEVSDADKN